MLKRGIETVQRALATHSTNGDGYDRVHQLVDLSGQITWIYLHGTELIAAEDTTVSDVQVVVINDEIPLGLNQDVTFQTREEDGGTVRIYVQRRPFTSTWAGIALFHELDHVLDHLDGSWPSNATSDDWMAAEARAYHREALVIDAVSGGNLLPALAELTAKRTMGELLALGADEVSSDLYRRSFTGRLREPHQSESERGARAAAFAFGAVVAAHASPVSLMNLTTSSAGSAVRDAAAHWGVGQVYDED